MTDWGKRGLILALAIMALALPASGQLRSTEVALNLGNVLGSEKGCDLKFNQKAIEDYIDKNVQANDMGFTSMLNMMTKVMASDLRRMGDSQKTAHCAQIRRVARANKFITE